MMMRRSSSWPSSPGLTDNHDCKQFFICSLQSIDKQACLPCSRMPFQATRTAPASRCTERPSGPRGASECHFLAWPSMPWLACPVQRRQQVWSTFTMQTKNKVHFRFLNDGHLIEKHVTVYETYWYRGRRKRERERENTYQNRKMTPNPSF